MVSSRTAASVFLPLVAAIALATVPTGPAESTPQEGPSRLEEPDRSPATAEAPGVCVDDPRLQRARTFNASDTGTDGYPLGVRDPDTYNPLDVDLMQRMSRELSTLELVGKALHPDAHTHLAARQALLRDRGRHADRIRATLSATGSSHVDRTIALEGIRIFGGAPFVDDLWAVARQAENPVLRGRALGLLPPDQRRDAMLAGLGDPSWTVNNSALGMLQREALLDPEIEAAVHGLLQKPKPIVRKRALAVVAAWSSAASTTAGIDTLPRSKATPEPVSPSHPIRTVTLAFQPGDGSPHSANADWRLEEASPDSTATLWSADVTVGRHYDLEERVLLNFPSIIGNAPGQVPVGVRVIDATVEVLANHARNIPIEIRRVTEPNLGQAGRIPGQDFTNAPSWNSRFHAEPWTRLGAGWPESSEPFPQDTQVVDTDYQWVTWDVTAAVQAWVDDPASNQGLLLATPDLSVEGQGFRGGSASDAHRPIITVTFLDMDLVPPTIAITTPPDSPVERAFVEGTVSPDAQSVWYSLNGEPQRPAVLSSPTRWHLWVDLVPGVPAELEVVARDRWDNVASSFQTLDWRPTDVGSSGELLLARGETALLRMSSSAPGAALVVIDPGDGQPLLEAAPGEDVPVRYKLYHVDLLPEDVDDVDLGSETFDAETRFVATCSVLDADDTVLEQQSLEVQVVELSEQRWIAGQVGYLRDMDFYLNPPDRLDLIHLEAANPDRLLLRELRIEDEEVLCSLAPLTSEPAFVHARLGGPSGRVFMEMPVYPFVIDMGNASDLVGAGETEFIARIVPASVLEVADFLEFEARVFNDGGEFEYSIDSDGDGIVRLFAYDFDEEGEVRLPVTVDPDLAVEFCRSLAAFNPQEFAVSRHVGKNTRMYGARVLVDPYPAPIAAAGQRNVTLTLEGTGLPDPLQVSNVRWYPDTTSLVPPAGTTAPPFPGASIQVGYTVAGKYDGHALYDWAYSPTGATGKDARIDFDVVVSDELLTVEIVAPYGDPAADPATGVSEYVFRMPRGGPPAKMIVPVEAKVTTNQQAYRDFAADKARWEITGIGDSQLVWTDGHDPADPSKGTGLKNKAKFIGLPIDNDQLGPKVVTLRVQGTINNVDFNLVETADIEVFFSRNQSAHPNNSPKTPNWYYYWGQTVTLPAGVTMQYSKTLGTGQNRAASHLVGDSFFKITDNAYKRRTIPYAPSGTAYAGIEYFHFVVRHELRHVHDATEWWQADPNHPTPGGNYDAWNNTVGLLGDDNDYDGDKIPTGEEGRLPDPPPARGPGHYNPFAAITYSRYKYVDNEDWNYRRDPVLLPAADLAAWRAADWAAPGYNHKKRTGYSAWND